MKKMENYKKGLLIVGIALLTLFVIFSCFFLPTDDFTKDGWYIKLNVDPTSGSKAIKVTEYTVTDLVVEVRDPSSVLIQTIDWQVGDGKKSYLIPVGEQGEYEIQVTHIGEENGEVFEATESATFNMQAMVITVIDIIPGFIGVINIEPGDRGLCEEAKEIVEKIMNVYIDTQAGASLAITEGGTMLQYTGAGGSFIWEMPVLQTGPTLTTTQTFDGYSLPSSGYVVTGVLQSMFVGDTSTATATTTGTLALSGGEVNTLTFDITLVGSTDDEGYFLTATVTGTVTANDMECDVAGWQLGDLILVNSDVMRDLVQNFFHGEEPIGPDIVGVWFGANQPFVGDPAIADLRYTFGADGYYEYLQYAPGTEEYYDSCTKGTYYVDDGTLYVTITHCIADVDPVTGEIIWTDFSVPFGSAPYVIEGDVLTITLDLSGWGGSEETVWVLTREQ